MTESIKTWETQLDSYRRHGAALQDVAQKARADIAQARQDIQRLSTQEVGSGTPVTAAAPLTVEEATEDRADQEAEKLRTQLQSCAGSMGVLPAMPTEASQVISDDEKDPEAEKGAKRPRPLEAGSLGS